ncbi:DUF397 domain-containing protein [Allokutzneria sp. A3M-2-11 16]|uniref:DUF397 domain-containing protein n=1 Tax=Allokutzneria sp. A3M-2-11 16 TaxID=2962043 RepID=UPI0020B83151|nr:DUF397 domain-containing protein [Allokutzneria sp. A3M-2-11 16]MCP3803526.1 DUF397 domain-containing protein [Allokutzneria sp. A3M-2-11 16]
MYRTGKPVVTEAAFPESEWRTSADCSGKGDDCVAVNLGRTGWVGVRDTKRPDGPVLSFTDDEWSARSFRTCARRAAWSRRPSASRRSRRR